MKTGGYEEPPNGDYVAYVDALLRSSPEYRRTQKSLGSAVVRAQHSPGSSGAASLAELRAKFERIKQQTQAAQVSLGAQVQEAWTDIQAAAQAAQGLSPSSTKPSSAQRRSPAPVPKAPVQGNKPALNGLPGLGGLGWFLIVAGVVLAQAFLGIGWLLILFGVFSYVVRVLKKMAKG